MIFLHAFLSYLYKYTYLLLFAMYSLFVRRSSLMVFVTFLSLLLSSSHFCHWFGWMARMFLFVCVYVVQKRTQAEQQTDPNQNRSTHRRSKIARSKRCLFFHHFWSATQIMMNGERERPPITLVNAWIQTMANGLLNEQTETASCK